MKQSIFFAIIAGTIFVFFYINIFGQEKHLSSKEKALLLFKQGKKEKAIAMITKLLAKNPQDKELQLYLSSIGEKSSYKKKVLTIQENNKSSKEDNIINDSKQLIKQKKYKKAIILLKKKIESEPDTIIGRQLIAKCYYHLNEYSKAYDFFRVLPEKSQNKYYMAYCLYNLKDYNTAIEYLDDVKSIDGLYLRGRCFQKLGDFDKAIRDLIYIDKYSPSIAIRKNLAFLLMKKAKYKLAEKYFEYLIEKRSKVADFHFQLAICREKIGDVDGALKEFKKTLILKKNDYKSLKAMGNLYYQKKDWNNSILCFKRALIQIPDSFSTLIKLGFAYNALDNKQEAMKCYKMALKCKNIGPDDKDKIVSLIQFTKKEI